MSASRNETYTDKPPSILRILPAIVGELSKKGIPKAQYNEQQRYKFRGIDDVYGALAPLLAEHGITIVPSVTQRTCTERVTHSGSRLICVSLDVEYTVYCAEDGSSITLRVSGEAMDSGDKATNKAFSAAFKYAMIQLFCIPIAGEDADAVSPESSTPASGAYDLERPDRKDPQQRAYQDLLTELYEKTPRELKTWRIQYTDAVNALPQVLRNAIWSEYARIVDLAKKQILEQSNRELGAVSKIVPNPLHPAKSNMEGESPK
jgi:ERF superfamily protein